MPTAGLVAGIAPSLLNGPLAAAATAMAGVPVEVSLSLWHGVTPALLLSVLTLAAVGLAYVARDALRTRTWQPRYGTEDVYDGATRRPRCGEPRDRAGAAQRVAAHLRHGHRGHDGRWWDGARC